MMMAIELELLAPAREPMSLVDGLAVSAPTGLPTCAYNCEAPEVLAEFLVHGVHEQDAGFEISVSSVDEGVQVLCATVAALTGDDIVAAATQPDEHRLAGLNLMAQDAVRERLRHLISPDPDAITDRLHALGLH